MSAPVVAASMEAKRSRAEDSDEVGVQKVTRLKELRSRLSPVRFSSSLPSSAVVDPLSGEHVAGSSPSLPALVLMLSTLSLLNFFLLDQSQSILLRPL